MGVRGALPNLIDIAVKRFDLDPVQIGVDSQFPAVPRFTDVPLRLDRVAVLLQGLCLVLEDLCRLEDVIMACTGRDIPDRGAIGRPQRITVWEFCPLIVLRVMRVNLLTLDLG